MMRKYNAKAKRETKRKAVKEAIIGEWDEYGQPIQTLKAIQPAKVALVFPSASCADVKEALTIGRITTNTKLLVVERDVSVVSTIKRKLTLMGFTDVYYHIGNLDSLDLVTVIESEFDGDKLDYAFFDVCGMVTKKLLDWFESNLVFETVEIGAHLIFTFECSGRMKNQFDVESNDYDNTNGFLKLFKERNLNGRAPSNETNDTIHFQTYAVYLALYNLTVKLGCVTSYNDTGCPMQVFDLKISKYHRNRNRQQKLEKLLY